VEKHHKNYTSDRGALATSAAAGPEIVSVRLLDTCSLYGLHLAGQGDDVRVCVLLYMCGVCVCVCVRLLYEEHNMRRTCFHAYIYYIQSVYCVGRHDVTVSSSIIVRSVLAHKHPACVTIRSDYIVSNTLETITRADSTVCVRYIIRIALFIPPITSDDNFLL